MHGLVKWVHLIFFHTIKDTKLRVGWLIIIINLLSSLKGTPYSQSSQWKKGELKTPRLLLLPFYTYTFFNLHGSEIIGGALSLLFSCIIYKSFVTWLIYLILRENSVVYMLKKKEFIFEFNSSQYKESNPKLLIKNVRN